MRMPEAHNDTFQNSLQKISEVITLFNYSRVFNIPMPLLHKYYYILQYYGTIYLPISLKASKYGKGNIFCRLERKVEV